LARTKSVSLARDLLALEWKSLLFSGRCDFDRLLVLIRTEIDLRRLEGKNYHSWAQAAYVITQTTGEETYRELAVLDLAIGFYKDWTQALKCVRQGGGISRFCLLIDELKSASSSPTTSAQTILKDISAVKAGPFGVELCLGPGRQNVDLDTMIQTQLNYVNQICFESYQILITLKPFNLKEIKAMERASAAIKSLAGGQPKTKKQFFQEVWNIGDFDKNRHDDAIRSLLKRLRKLGLELKTQKSELSIEGIVYVED